MEFKNLAYTENPKIIPRVAVVQDVSGFGRVSLTEAIPVLASMGVESCPLPTAVLSTHTYEFENYTFLDTTDEMSKIISHWDEINLAFDAVYSGYMSSSKQIENVSDFMLKQKKLGAKIVVDPVLGDNALLDVETVYSERMRCLIDGIRNMCSFADVITPNLTETCILLGDEYPNGYISDIEIRKKLEALAKLGANSVAITSIMDSKSSMCVAVFDGKDFYKIDCGYVNRRFHGTGDIFASVLTGGLVSGKSFLESAGLATDFVSEAIKKTLMYENVPVRYGVLFELVLKDGYFSKDKINAVVHKL